MTPAQRSTVHVAARVAPNDEAAWRHLDDDQSSWLNYHSYAYLLQRTTPSNTLLLWPAEESDLARLSEAFPGTLFVSSSVATSEPDVGTRWRVFALNGESWRSIETDGEWAHPLLSGLGPSHFGAVAGGMSSPGATPAAAPVRSGAGTSQSAAGRLGTSGETEP